MAELSSGVSALIEKIKNDGIVEGETQKAQILGAAEKEAAAIIEKATKAAEAMRAKAKADMEAMHARALSELRMAVRDFIFTFQQGVRQKRFQPLLESQLQNHLNEPEFLGNLLTDLLKAQLGKAAHTHLVVSPEMKEALSAYLRNALETDLGDAPIQISEEPGLEGFRFKRDEDGFYWDFSLETISEELTNLVEPRLKPYLNLQEVN